MRPFLIAAGLTLATQAAAQTPVLTIYTYDSFVSEWGPGPVVEAAFEETCGCDVKFVPAGDGAALLARLELEGDTTEADIVLGLDTNLTARAAASGLFVEHGQVPDLDLPIAWNDALFLPYDWGHFAFVHDKAALPNPPTGFAELAASDVSILIQDPRSSTPGLGLLMWVKAAHGEQAEAIWQGLSDNIVTVTPGWSEAYGLFLEGEADMVLSYTSSPAYHRIAEEDDSKSFARFDEGHYLQVEVAGKVAGTDVPDLADDFLAFMLTEGFQGAIPTTNWMYPAVTPEGGLPEGFGAPVAPEDTLFLPADAAAELRGTAVAEWRAALAR